MAEADILSERRSYIAGRWVESDEVVAVENPADESLVAELAATPLPEVHRAIAEARRSFDQGTWADLPAKYRAQVLHTLLNHLERSTSRWWPPWWRKQGSPSSLRRWRSTPPA